jgi:ABC-type uncharacterized transport system substrate-binding protein
MGWLNTSPSTARETFNDARVRPYRFFSMRADPVAFGLVKSHNRPGRNLTGIATLGMARVADSCRLVGRYIDRLLKGDKPADLPTEIR